MFHSALEIMATIIENFIILNFLGKMLEYKFDGLKKKLFFITALAISSIYVTIHSELMLFEGGLVIFTIIIFVLYSLFFLVGKVWKKIVFPIMAISIITCINLSVTYLFASMFGEHLTYFMSPDSSMRPLTLFITKFAFFIITRIILYLFKMQNFDLQRDELVLISILFILSNSIAIVNFEIQIGKDKGTMNMISSFLIIAINVFVFFMFRRMSIEHRSKLKVGILEAQLSEQKQMIDEAKYLTQEIKKA